MEQQRKSNIKILVSNRIDMDSKQVLSPLFFPIKCGAELADFPLDMPGDNIGDNISCRRDRYSELTVLYWAWKNLEADYYGLFHYRRYYAFSDHDFSHLLDAIIEPKGQGIVVEPEMDSKTIDFLGLDEKTMRPIIEAYDVITHPYIDVRKIEGLGYSSALDCKEQNLFLHNPADIIKMKRVVHELYPEYDPYVEKYYSAPYAKWYLLFIMKKELFHPMCKWLFDIVFELEKRIDYSNYSAQQERAVGYFAEDLVGIYFLKLFEDTAVKVKYLPLVLFLDTQKGSLPKPVNKKAKNKNAVVIRCEDKYLPRTLVCIQSILSTTKDATEFVLLSDNTPQAEIKAAAEYYAISSGANIRIICKAELADAVAESTSTHFDLVQMSDDLLPVLIPYIFCSYERVLFLNSTFIFREDCSELFSLDLMGQAVAASFDIPLQGNINGANKDVQAFYSQVPVIENLYEYKSTDIVLYDIDQCLKKYPFTEILALLAQGQGSRGGDLFNRLYDNNTVTLDSAWNVWSLDGLSKWAVECAPAQRRQAYYQARKSPKAINYGHEVNDAEIALLDLGLFFVEAAKQCIVYRQPDRPISQVLSGEKNYTLKKIIDWAFPKESGRRKIAKRIYKFFKNC